MNHNRSSEVVQEKMKNKSTEDIQSLINAFNQLRIMGHEKKNQQICKCASLEGIIGLLLQKTNKVTILKGCF